MRDEKEKNETPFDSENEDETIALSREELDDILSEAEIIQETTEESKPVEYQKEKKQEESKPQEKETEEPEEPSPGEEEEFDISEEVEQLTPEDLEEIELEESEFDTYTKELEGEIEEEEGESLEDLEKELEGIDTEGMKLEANLEEDLDLDSYLDSVKSDVNLEELEKELEEKEIKEPETKEKEVVEAEESFKQAGIEEPPVSEPSLEEAKPETVEEIKIEKEAEVQLTPGEEEILNKDLELQEETPEGEVEEEVVALSGAELEEIELEEEKLPEPEELEVGIGEEEVTKIGELPQEEKEEENIIKINKTLYDDITKVLKYMDSLLGDLPEDKIKEFAKSEYFNIYKRVFEELKLK